MSTGLVNINQTQAAIKKLFGKAHTSALKGVGNESIASGVPVNASKIFGQAIPNAPGSSPSLYDIVNNAAGKPVLERVKLTLTSISGTNYDADSLSSSDIQIAGGGTSDSTVLAAGTGTSAAGAHGYAAALPSDYVSNSSNAKKGSGVFVNSQVLNTTLGGLQIINEANSTTNPNQYSAVLRESDNTLISATSAIDYLVDTFSGVVFVQDFDSATVPASIECWIYIGDMADVALGGSTSTASGKFIGSGSISASINVGNVDIFRITSASKELVSLRTSDNETNFNVNGNIVANKYIVSSSVTFMTQSFSTGNTVFGDGLTDTHLFTGSLFLTGSGTYASMSGADYNEIGYVTKDASGRSSLKFSHVIDGGSF